MKVHVASGGLAETNCYLILDEATKKAAMVDAPEGTTGELLALAKKEGYELVCLLLTHGHWDHISDHKVVTDAFPGAKVLIHRLDEPKLRKPGSSMWELPYVIPPRSADGYLEEGQPVAVGDLQFEVLHTPGHIAGHACLYCASERIIFTGDLLMAGAVGRYDLEEGNLELLQQSLRRVMALPAETRVLPGHGDMTTIANENHGNMFIRQWGLGNENAER